MKKIAAMLLIAVMAFGVELTVDEKASSVNFEATKMFFVGVDGDFSDFSGTISVEGNAVTAINGVIKVLSINTEDKKRDDHLLSSDFFHEVKFDAITFKSTKIEDAKVVADITIKGITKSVSFTMESLSVSEESVKVKLTAVVDRTEFGIDNNFIAIPTFEISV